MQIRLTNTTDQPITATTGHSVPANGETIVTGADWDRISQEPYISGQVRRGRLVPSRVNEVAQAMADELAEDAPTLTREDIARMRKADLRDLLEAHGIEDVPELVADMRTLAERVVFFDG